MLRTASLVERERQLRTLGGIISESSDSGRVVLVSGEAGHGKTSLLDAVRVDLDHRYTVLAAACEPVGVPAAFAPLFELLDDLPEQVSNDVRSKADRPAVYAGMLDFLRSDRVVLVIEDLHWADEATLGLVRFLGRRISTTTSTLIGTFRPEEIDPTHLFRVVMADLGPAAERIDLPPLSPEGVAAMTQALDLDSEAVHAATLGNPFFVEEVVRHPESDVPPTVENAILASVAHLPEEALELLYVVALSPEGIDVDVIIDLGFGSARLIDLAVQRRLLVSSDGRVACRHDLIQESLVRSVPPVLRRNVHKCLLAAFEGRTADSAVTAELAYHSVGAEDADKAAAYSVRAARDAAALNSNRQAAIHYSNALKFVNALEPETLDEVLLEAAQVHCALNNFGVAIELGSRLVDRAADAPTAARARAWLSYFLCRQNDLDGCRREALRAIDDLEDEPPSEELALSLAVVAWTDQVEGKKRAAIEYGDRAVEVARQSGAATAEVHAATAAGSARLLLGDRTGRRQIDEAVELSVRMDLGEFAGRAISYPAAVAMWRGEPGQAFKEYDRLIEYTADHELEAWHIGAIGGRAYLEAIVGRWDEAETDLALVSGQPTCRASEVLALTTEAILRARQGQPDALSAVQDAVASAEGFADLDASAMACALAMEGAWMGLVPKEEAVDRYEAFRTSPALADHWPALGLLGYWSRRLDLNPPADWIPGPAGLEWEGDTEAAARSWEESGYPVEAAVTRAMVPDADLHPVFSDLADLGAYGTIEGVRRELRRRGIKNIPRGRRPTQANPAGLTPRQAEVLSLMATGLSNPEIAEELYISHKTAEHHVSAVLAQLGVSTRVQAVAVASANGWV